MKRTIAMLALGAMLSLAAPAQEAEPAPGPPPGSDPAGELAAPAEPAFEAGYTFNGITLEELKKVMDSAGYAATIDANASAPSADSQTPGGYRFSAFLGDCPETGEKRCQSLNFWSYGFNESSNVTLKSLNEWNINAWAARGVLFKDGTSGVRMNVSLTGGVNEIWLKQQVLNYDYWTTQFANYVGGVKPQ